MDEQLNGYLPAGFNNKKEQTANTLNDLGGPEGHFNGSKTSNSKGHILYDSVYRTVSK